MMDGLRAMVEPDGVMTRGLEWIGDGVRIWCTHLKGGNGEGWECGIYNRRPQICKDFNCVSWAKVSNNKELYNEVLKKIGMT